MLLNVVFKNEQTNYKVSLDVLRLSMKLQYVNFCTIIEASIFVYDKTDLYPYLYTND
jgi:hypothetical protein